MTGFDRQQANTHIEEARATVFPWNAELCTRMVHGYEAALAEVERQGKVIEQIAELMDPERTLLETGIAGNDSDPVDEATKDLVFSWTRVRTMRIRSILAEWLGVSR